MALGTVPTLVPVYEYLFEIDTTPTGTTRTWANVCAGFNNIAEALNETVQQYFFLCGNGFAANYTTGMAPAYTLTGVRVLGDAAQEFIFGFDIKYGLNTARETHCRLTRKAIGSETAEVMSFNAMLANITDVGGGTTDGSAVSVEIRMNGAPEEGDAWA